MDERVDESRLTRTNPRLCLLINDLARAGAETQLVELALALSASGHAVEIVLLKQRNDFADILGQAGIPVTLLGRAGWWDLGVAYRLFRHLRRAQPDVLHSFLFLSNLLGVLAGRLAGVKSIVASQRCSYQGMLRPPWRWLARWSHRRADRVIINSRAAWREEVAAGLPADRADCIPNGVRPSTVLPPNRHQLGLPEGPVVLSVGQLEAIKGHRWLLDAWSAVHASCPEATLLLLGDGSLRQKLVARARRNGLGDSVRFLGFRAPAAPYLLACDFLVQPSLSEGMPNAVLEAMVAGRAVVGTATGGLPELVVDQETGLLVPPRDSAALSQAILWLLRDPLRCAAMGDAARRRARDGFSMAQMVALTESAYRKHAQRWPALSRLVWLRSRPPTYRIAFGRRGRLPRAERDPGIAAAPPLPGPASGPRTTAAR